jgi:hypothetical protein
MPKPANCLFLLLSIRGAYLTLLGVVVFHSIFFITVAAQTGTPPIGTSTNTMLPAAGSPKAPPKSESLPRFLNSVGQLQRLDEPPISESPIDPVFRSKEGVSSRKRYQQYLGKIAALQRHLVLLQQRLGNEAMDANISLQELAALNHSSLRLYEALLPTLSLEEKQFSTFYTLSQAVLTLDETVQYWRIRHTLTPPFRTEEMAMSEDRYVLDIKLQTLQQALAQLQDWNTLHQTLQTGFKAVEDH